MFKYISKKISERIAEDFGNIAIIGVWIDDTMSFIDSEIENKNNVEICGNGTF